VTTSTISFVTFVAELSDSVTTVAYADYPPTQVDPAPVLDGVVSGAAMAVAGTVASKTPTTVNGSPAVDYVIEMGGWRIPARAILVGNRLGNRLYVLQGPTIEVDPDGFGRLIGSFELLG
jgi:hypothetical protein